MNEASSLATNSTAAVRAADGGDVDDVAAALLAEHHLDGLAHGVHGALDVDGEDLVPALVGDVADGLEAVHDAGVVDEDVELAALLHGVVDHAVVGLAARDVAHVGQNLARQAVCLDLGGKLGEALLASGHGHDRGALLGEVIGDLTAHARAGTGDDDALSLKTHSKFLSLLGNAMSSSLLERETRVAWPSARGATSSGVWRGGAGCPIPRSLARRLC